MATKKKTSSEVSVPKTEAEKKKEAARKRKNAAARKRRAAAKKKEAQEAASIEAAKSTALEAAEKEEKSDDKAPEEASAANNTDSTSDTVTAEVAVVEEVPEGKIEVVETVSTPVPSKPKAPVVHEAPPEKLEDLPKEVQAAIIDLGRLDEVHVKKSKINNRKLQQKLNQQAAGQLATALSAVVKRGSTAGFERVLRWFIQNPVKVHPTTALFGLQSRMAPGVYARVELIFGVFSELARAATRKRKPKLNIEMISDRISVTLSNYVAGKMAS